ncbi:Oxysterol-binding protein-related protein 3 [Gracilariopsis chorda]|uniref:Oxysterol-binding protein-related protein 3 n=1 Tax=Gracilariopsis chorda TaxID=448386 RepID=A0A2V3IMX3_9FLOR|nr:Oxysterol-binding protein-related protein 3 [Gracilariopsis chorda]|eukprot:PXF43422.1 Oxysterol-binding protein-related protein 3 [Gracilariopsis chorda]
MPHMPRMKRILHRRRSSGNADAHVVTLSLRKDDFHNLTATDPGVVRPQKTGVLLKFTNVIKGWKPRLFVLENGFLEYSAVESDDTDSPSSSTRNLLENDRQKKKRSKKLRIIRRAFSRDEQERDIKGRINLQMAAISPDESDDCRFAIDVGHDVYHCKADSRAERDEWVHILIASKAYFQHLIQTAFSRSQQSIKASESPDNKPRKRGSALSSQPSGLTLAKPREQQPSPQVSEDSEESVLEDDGLKEAEQSRLALMTELRRILTVWKDKLDPLESKAHTSEDLLRVLADTFTELGAGNHIASRDHVREATKGLIDLTAWCLNVLQTNDDMFDRRLKADLARLAATEIPVFQEVPSPDEEQDDAKILDDSSDDEFFDALSRVASLRSSARLSGLAMGPFRSMQPALPQIQEEDATAADLDKVKRVSTVVLSRPLKGERTTLPRLPPNREKPSVLALLKDSVGKDLSRISFPVSLNEPVSFVQRLAEDIEYCELLDKGARESDPDRRMMYVATMVISHYSSTLGRIAKPFNPMLGETACVVRPTKGDGVRFVAEQVSHHPPVSACYAEGSGALWKYYNAIEIKHKFWGKSLEIIPTGLNHVEFPDTGDHYVFNQVSTCVHNIVIGRMWLDNYGEMEIVNKTNGGRCVIDFRKSGWIFDAGSLGAITATIYDANGKRKIRLGGNWTKSVYEDLGKGKRNVLWVADERPPASHSQTYNLTKWAIALNTPVHADERKFVAPTDSRLRPDQRALENGEYDRAAKLKSALEEAQRRRRRDMDENGEKWEPRWFEKVTDQETDATDYRYRGGFFEKHSKGDWGDCINIFDISDVDL